VCLRLVRRLLNASGAHMPKITELGPGCEQEGEEQNGQVQGLALIQETLAHAARRHPTKTAAGSLEVFCLQLLGSTAGTPCRENPSKTPHICNLK